MSNRRVHPQVVNAFFTDADDNHPRQAGVAGATQAARAIDVSPRLKNMLRDRREQIGLTIAPRSSAATTRMKDKLHQRKQTQQHANADQVSDVYRA